MYGSTDRQFGKTSKGGCRDPRTDESVLGPPVWSGLKKRLQGSTDHRFGPNFLKVMQRSLDHRFGLNFQRRCRDPGTAESVRILKIGFRDPRTAGLGKNSKGGCRHPRTDESVRIFQGHAEILGPPIWSEFKKGNVGINGPPVWSEFKKRDSGIQGPPG